MNTEDFVTYKQAVTLKKCGFDLPCIAQWAAEPDGKPYLMGSTAFVFRNSECKGRDVCAPTLAQAAKWLREVKEIKIYSMYDYFDKMWYFHCGLRLNSIKNSATVYSTYESALSTGIDAALDIVKEEK